MKKRRRLKKSFAIIFCALILGSTIFASATFCFDAVNANEEIRIEKYDVLSYNSKASDDVVYLSDIPYMKAQIGWKTIGLDKTNDNANLVMRIDNSSVVVKKEFGHMLLLQWSMTSVLIKIMPILLRTMV